MCIRDRALLDELAPPQAHGVAPVAGRASIDGAVAILGGDVRGDAQLAHPGDEVGGVVALVGSDAHAPAAAAALASHEAQAGLALGRACLLYTSPSPRD